ncbi:Zinc finger, RING-type [Corchorus capsularis]|uniref:Zinc finger, RING-type n=1 Tax=Corchorus capsularis TaxID=210143 RepID=A0A1R3JKR9_COCAP|nr:Zinc finger, RING-type [Corchorus capsularis]
MVRGGKVGHRSNSKKRVRSKDEGSDDSDEDYVVSAEENDDTEGDAEDYCSSLDECASEESFGSFVDEEDEEEEEVVRKVVRPKARRMPSPKERKIVGRKSRKRKSASDEEEEEVDEDYVEEKMPSPKEMKIVGRKSRKQKSASDEEEEDEDYVEEKMPSPKEMKIVGRKSRKQKSASDEEEEDEDYVEEEEEEEEEVDEEEDDDEEFTLDEEDCLDEEEELTMKKKKNNLKVSRQGFRKSGPSRRRKNWKKPVASKKQGGRKKRTLKRKKRVEEDEDEYDCDFIDSSPIVRKKIRTNIKRRKKAYVVPSDSDFVSSGSSDYEYTISEEEREQVREASALRGGLKANLRSSSSSKRIQEVEDLGQCKKPPGRKGKEKLEEIKAEVIKQVCGICLSEEDKRRLRGTLNCCSHYFCFTCIMEWSKVESRCPLCKQRFETISKPARAAAGVDLRDVVPKRDQVCYVPKRDQVYQPSEEELRSYLDPYENVICSECHQGGDDELMLLCDLCDSSAHTYCVGLGREVPEGNWYCDGCKPVALGSSSSQVPDSLPDQRPINNLYNRLSPIVNVGETLDSIVVPSPRMPLPPGFAGLSSPRFPVGDIPAISPGSGAGAPTLTQRRWLHRQIQTMRMNRMTGRADGLSAVNMGIDLINSHIDQSRETTAHQARAQDMTSLQQTVFEQRIQDDPSSSLQSRDLFPSRLGHLRRQDSSTTTFNTPVNLTLWPGLAGISSNDQLRHCSNGSNIGPDGCGLPYSVRDEDNFSIAREQLQAMVRVHMKELSKDFELDNGSYKDIATRSIHTVLAACGLEHRRSEDPIVSPPSNCTHMERLAAGQMSLLKGCCLTCFDSFVKYVVKKIMDTTSPRLCLSLAL